MTYFKKASLVAVAVSAVVASAQPAFAQGGEAIELEEVVIMGSRSNKPRSATDSTVPVDVFSEAEISAFGNQADITDTLKALVPSYTATPATGDGSAFIRPTSLRGMAPDQSLVLVNGKRLPNTDRNIPFAPALRYNWVHQYLFLNRRIALVYANFHPVWVTWLMLQWGQQLYDESMQGVLPRQSVTNYHLR